VPTIFAQALGIRLAVCVDPDGLAMSFAEPLTREKS
jgi:hypothetical protein